jgi:CheY-like chemotaxis protein
VRRIAEEVGSVLSCQAAAKGVELIVDVADEVRTALRGDPPRLRQCLLNLLGNAVKFTSAGEIVLQVGCKGSDATHQQVLFEVRDTGMGIDARTLASLFQPFVQADSSTTRRFGGTGLGLSIVRRLVEMMGGKVSVASEPGQGSTFAFDVPLQLPLLAQQASVGRMASARVLIADGNASVRRMVTARLTHAGHQVTTADTGRQALAMLQTTTFDVVLYDAGLSDSSNSELAACMQPESSLVLLVRADRDSKLQRAALPGRMACLTKPLRVRELLEAIDTALALRQGHDAIRLEPARVAAALPRTLAGQVLLVEDNAVNQKVAQRLLERMGCQVRIAENGLEGVQLFARQRFDLVLMDLQMPVLDGFGATRGIRNLPAGDVVPIVALTANATCGEPERCAAEGMNGFLTKPIDVARLQGMLAGLGLALPNAAKNVELSTEGAASQA